LQFLPCPVPPREPISHRGHTRFYRSVINPRPGSPFPVVRITLSLILESGSPIAMSRPSAASCAAIVSREPLPGGATPRMRSLARTPTIIDDDPLQNAHVPRAL